jgi:hypothetical protein
MLILSCDAAFVLENLGKDVDALVLKPGTRLRMHATLCKYLRYIL